MQHCLILGGGLSGKAAERLAVSLGFSAAVLSDSPGLDADAAVAPEQLPVGATDEFTIPVSPEELANSEFGIGVRLLP